MRDANDRVYGGYTSIEWPDHCATKRRNFEADDKAFLFSLCDHLGLYRAVGPRPNNLYVESSPQSEHSHKPGFGMGGVLDKFRFFVDRDFNTVTWLQEDTSFEATSVQWSGSEHRLKALEVWGCGGKEAEQAKKRRARAAAEARDARMRDLALKTVGGKGGQALMDMVGIGVGQEARDRAQIDGVFENH